jgi:uncharacterized protein DUF6448
MEDCAMKRLVVFVLLGGLALWPLSAQAHCDAVDGPVATAAVKALDTKNVNLILPYAPMAAEPELTAAFEQALVVRGKGPEAKGLADRYFMETAVRLHRAGENAPYTGLKPAGMDFGPAIPAAETALESGAVAPLVTLMSQEVARGIAQHFELAISRKAAAKEPATKEGVVAARERVSAELDFIGYVERIYLATKREGHTE